MTTPKVEPPKDEVRDKIENLLVKVRKFEITENTATQITLALIKLQQEALLSKVEAELPQRPDDNPADIIKKYKNAGEYIAGHESGIANTVDKVQATIDKLRLEL